MGNFGAGKAQAIKLALPNKNCQWLSIYKTFCCCDWKIQHMHIYGFGHSVKFCPSGGLICVVPFIHHTKLSDKLGKMTCKR